jgi:polyhydroxybutyrate depolymerase
MTSMRYARPARRFVLGILGCGLWACSSSDGGSPMGGTMGSGGTANAGGAIVSGGSGGGSGGAQGTGGSTATGGSVVAGGTQGSGGVEETGGAVGTGGGNSGGTRATGGTSSGGARTGGWSTGGAATGGVGRGGSPTGGSNTGGGGSGGRASGGAATGGSSTGGAATGGSGSGGSGSGGSTAGGTGGSTAGGTGGSTGSGSPGCGSTSPLKTGNFTESINGTSRRWMLDVPTGYDGSKPYRLIFVWHPLGGSGSQVVNGGYNGLKSLANSTAIFATADGLNGSNGEASGTGWWNANGGDMKLFQAMLDKINAGLCIDQERIFSTGFSFGGMMSYTLPFEFDVFRAVAPCSGKTGVIPYNDNFGDPVAIMAFHGDSDTFVATALGKAFFDKFAARNKCGTQTQPVSPNGCVQYQGCVVPSIWCLFSGAHTTWSEEPAAIWKFFSQF